MTNETPIRTPDQIRQDAARKLKMVKVGDLFQATLGCLLNEDWTNPRIISISITSDGRLFGHCQGKPHVRVYLGTPHDLIRNLHRVAGVAKLDGDEIGYLLAKMAGLARRS
jgi:hypothetical protein